MDLVLGSDVQRLKSNTSLGHKWLPHEIMLVLAVRSYFFHISMMLCFAFAIKTVLVTDQCFSCF